jgi:hypothetical protein
MLVAAHAGTAEWRRAVNLSALEQALLRLQLPPLRELAGIDDRGEAPPTVYTYALPPPETDETVGLIRALHRRPGLHGWTVHVGRRLAKLTARYAR